MLLYVHPAWTTTYGKMPSFWSNTISTVNFIRPKSKYENHKAADLGLGICTGYVLAKNSRFSSEIKPHPLRHASYETEYIWVEKYWGNEHELSNHCNISKISILMHLGPMKEMKSNKTWTNAFNIWSYSYHLILLK